MGHGHGCCECKLIKIGPGPQSGFTAARGCCALSAANCAPRAAAFENCRAKRARARSAARRRRVCGQSRANRHNWRELGSHARTGARPGLPLEADSFSRDSKRQRAQTTQLGRPSGGSNFTRTFPRAQSEFLRRQVSCESDFVCANFTAPPRVLVHEDPPARTGQWAREAAFRT